MFRDRQEAGRKLADELAKLSLPDPMVLALPRGGVPVAAGIARPLGAPLDLVIVRKVGAPGNPELAVAAIVDGDPPDVVLNREIADACGLDDCGLEALIARERPELERRGRAYRAGRGPLEARMPIPSDESGIAAAEAFRRSARSIEDRLTAMKEEFLGIVGDDGRASWRAETGDPTHVLALHAHAADLVVTGSPTTADRARAVDAGTLILAAGRPVLFAADKLPPLRAERIVVAWKDAREARRAVADATPFLTHAKEVVVVASAETDSFKAREGSADVVRYLMRHGAKARAGVMAGPEPDVAGALAAKALEVGADLVVAGGYGHGRLREWAFGGVTRSLLSDGTLHRLLSN